MLPNLETSALVVIDIQERLFPAMFEADQASLVKATRNLVAAHIHFGGPVFFSEQYPRGLGPTIADLQDALAGATRLEKVAFSVAREASHEAVIKGLPTDVVLVGIAAHVCVLLTGMDLLAAGHRVWIPIDGVASRAPRFRDNGLDQLAKAGAQLVNSESLIFAQLERAGTDAFKTFSRMIR